MRKFSRLTRPERLLWLREKNLLSAAEVAFLQNSAPCETQEISDKLIENFIGCFAMPLGVVPDFPLDGCYYTIPMAIEETSVVAAVNHMAKWIRESGEMTSRVCGKNIIGQIQVPHVKNFLLFKSQIENKIPEWINLLNTEVVANLVKRGGGVKEILVREMLPSDHKNHHKNMAVIHILMDPCDAMGANLINQACEFLRAPVEMLTGEKVGMCILSNLTDTRITEAYLRLYNIDSLTAEKIIDAGLFAKHDPYRAATHNKGVMNGMDAVLLATGNDWRAVEAGVHAYAARDGQYRAITEWSMEGNDLVGKIRAPIIAGTVGGVTRTHPMAKLCLKLLGVTHAEELSRIVAAVGLVQNLAAIRALTSGGIVRGHMKLHIDNLFLAAGALPQEIQALRHAAELLLSGQHRITQNDIVLLLTQWREKQHD